MRAENLQNRHAIEIKLIDLSRDLSRNCAREHRMSPSCVTWQVLDDLAVRVKTRAH
jgi:hypothetical protein